MKTRYDQFTRFVLNKKTLTANSAGEKMIYSTDLIQTGMCAYFNRKQEVVAIDNNKRVTVDTVSISLGFSPQTNDVLNNLNGYTFVLFDKNYKLISGGILSNSTIVFNLEHDDTNKNNI